MRSPKLLHQLHRFGRDDRGNIALMMGLLAVPLIGAAGLGLDYARSANYRSSLNSAAASASLAAVDTARALIAANPNMPQSDVIAATQDRVTKVFAARVPQSSDVTLRSSKVTVARVGETISATVSFAADMTTTFSGVVGFTKFAVEGSATSSGVYDETQKQNNDPNLLITESFKVDPSTMQNGSWGVYANYNNWITTGAGVEIGKYQNYGAAPPSGSLYVAELDGKGNTAISKKVYMPTGNYELRYWIKDRLAYTQYDPAWVCGSRTEDVDWAGESTESWGYQSNRVGVYFDIALGDTPPATYSPSTNNLIDVCVNTGQRWVERSVKITMNQPSFYWLTFNSEGTSDGGGGVITDIRLCKNTCSGAPSSNFPWANGALLFNDSFEKLPPTPPGGDSRDRTLDISGDNYGWPRLPTGWTTWPYNQVDYIRWVPFDGPIGVELDASKRTGTNNTSNRAISRRFILTPGYYKVSYAYASYFPMNEFTYCGAQDASSHIALLSTIKTESRSADTNLLRVYMDSDRMFSHPSSVPIVNTAATWSNPDGSAPTLPPIASTVIDACVSSKAVTPRTVHIAIQKTGFYWLTFRGEGMEDQGGPGLDAITLHAVSDLTGLPPAGVVTIPAPGLPQGATIVMRGMQIAAQ